MSPIKFKVAGLAVYLTCMDMVPSGHCPGWPRASANLSCHLLPLPRCLPQTEMPSYDLNSFGYVSILKILCTTNFSTKRYYSRHDRRQGSHTSWMTNGPTDVASEPCRCVVAQSDYVLGIRQTHPSRGTKVVRFGCGDGLSPKILPPSWQKGGAGHSVVGLGSVPL